MIKVDSKVKLNMEAINTLLEGQKKALAMTAEALHTDVVQAQVMPFDTGALQNDATYVKYGDIDKGVASIVSSTPYARRLYFHPEYNYKTKENPNAGGRWFEDWLEGGIKEDWCKNVFAQIYKGVTKV